MFGYRPHHDGGDEYAARPGLRLCDVRNVVVVEIENTFDVLNDGRGCVASEATDNNRRCDCARGPLESHHRRHCVRKPVQSFEGINKLTGISN